MKHLKTKKISTSINKKLLWQKFKEEITDKNENSNEIECVYRKNGERELCDCCQQHLITTDEGFLACINKTCGIIYTDKLDQTAEWKHYSGNDSGGSDPSRCGMPINPLLKESSFGCKVMCQSKTSYEMRKIKRYTEWQGMPYKEKSQYEEFQKISILANQAGIPKLIVDEAIRHHKRISEAMSFRGLNRDGIIAASIYVAARTNSYPRTAKEIAVIFNLDNTSATKGCKKAMTIINELENSSNNKDEFNNKTNNTVYSETTPLSFIDRYCSKLNMNNELTKLSKFIAIRIQNNNIIPENTPHSIAAGIIYFIAIVCNLNINKKDVSKISEISEVTINKCYKKLDLMKYKLLPKVIIDKYNI